MTDEHLHVLAAAVLAALERDEQFATALKRARIEQAQPQGSLVEHAARAVAMVESLTQRVQSITQMRRDKGKAQPVPRPEVMRAVGDAAALLNNVLIYDYVEGQRDDGG